MATHRVIKTGRHPPPFTRIDNSMLQDERMSFKARGLLAYMLSKPDNFRFYLDELVQSLRPELGFPVVENPTLITNDILITNNKRLNKYIAFENIENPYFKTYLKNFALKKNKQHMRITEEQYQSIGEQIEQLKSFGVTAEEWEAKVMDHFRELPKSNNGNIIAFLHAAPRRFDLG